MKQGKWLIHHDELRGEPGFEEEGEYKEGRKEGVWRQYSLMGDLVGVEFYKWGNKDGVSKYYAPSGELLREESWIALNPNKPYDTLQIEDVDRLDHYKSVVVKNEGIAIKNGTWKYYDPSTGTVYKTETYTVGKLEIPKATARNSTDTAKSKIIPKEVLDYQKKNSGKKIKVRDGSVDY
jgi:antitoxin component YwqK of YwqJK toxin-antitoxin module